MKKHVKSLAGVAAAAILSLAPAALAQQPGTHGTDPNATPQSQYPDRGAGRQNPGMPGTRPMDTQEPRDTANRLTGDGDFAMKAAQGGMAEVELGKLAQDRAENADVKSFGRRMADDHSKANDELKEIASKNSITLPTGLDTKDKATMDRLSKLSGAQFDRAYMRQMVSDHRKDVNEFRRESENGTNPDLKSFAAKTLPTLEEHLKMAEQTQGKLKGAGK